MSILWPTRDERHADLLRRARSGDRRAFSRLIRELEDPVRAYIFRRVLNRADAEDLVGRVFERMVERLEQFDPLRGAVRPWVLRIARNAIIDHLRTRKVFSPLDTLGDPVPADVRDPLDDLIERERVELLAELVRALPAETKELFALRYGDGLRHREIAEVCGISVAAVKQRVSRARRELKARLRDREREMEAPDYAV
ncbi:MAG: sigma-70 family RNA polymerase sigma factor [Myxococcales bacterium]|nr:sigma-70 family RNA polymerase sigma factor [Myxococcales bacterium]MCB9752280.1 sigma-70 family RNA polymerase sigma factor [Myxococcales bacterium]